MIGRLVRGIGWGVAWLALAAWADAPLTATLSTEEYPPYMSQRLPHGGLLTRMVTETFREAGVAVKLEYVPNNRAITGPMLGLYDGSFGWARSPEREQKLLYSKPIATFRMVFFVRRDRSYPWQSLRDLAPYRIGATRGNHYSDEFSALQQSGALSVDESMDDVDGMRKLRVGRIDLFPMEQEAGQFLLLQHFPAAERKQITFQQDAIWEVPVHLVIYRGHPRAADLIARFDRAFQALTASGRLKRMNDDTRRAIAAKVGAR